MPISMWELLSAIERAEHEQYIKKQAEALADVSINEVTRVAAGVFDTHGLTRV